MLWVKIALTVNITVSWKTNLVGTRQNMVQRSPNKCTQ